MSEVETVHRKCPAKVNLFLEILGRRPDGFHELETVMAEIDLHDDLEIERATDGIHLSVEGDATVPADEGNRVHRAAAAVRRDGEGVRIRRVKRIPAGGGLGGGSSDAAATLLALDELFDLRARGVDLTNQAARLGSDVPFFLTGGVALCRGRGEIVEPVPGVAPIPLTLFISDIHVPTARVYEGLRLPLTPRITGANLCLGALRRSDPRGVGRALFNRLEESAFALFPGLIELRDLLTAIGFCDTRLSGSGSALFTPAAPSQEHLERLSTERPDVRTLQVQAGGSLFHRHARGAPGEDH